MKLFNDTIKDSRKTCKSKIQEISVNEILSSVTNDKRLCDALNKDLLKVSNQVIETLQRSFKL